jgi:hypothetical protein
MVVIPPGLRTEMPPTLPSMEGHQELVFIHNHSGELCLTKEQTTLRNGFVQRGRRHNYPTTIRQPRHRKRRHCRSIRGGTDLIAAVPSPTSFLSQHKVDPFRSQYLHHENEMVAARMEYMWERIYPQMLRGSATEQSAIMTQWRVLGHNDLMIFHLQSSAAINISQAARRAETTLSHNLDIISLEHQTRGLSLLQSELVAGPKEHSDTVIMAMVIAGMLSSPQAPAEYGTRRQSSLAEAQSVHLYARLGMVATTAQALVEAVNRRGGLLTIKSYGLAEILQL